jgi:multimeric flavodoxin WrbA
MSKVKFDKTIEKLKGKEKILFLLTSNRWEGHNETPKSSALAYKMQEELGKNAVTIIDVSKLKIYECEGNVSSKEGNNCGVKESLLKNGKDKTGELRCWASFNNKDDELYKVVNELLTSDAVIFFGSIRWGKMNAVYAKLVERLTWLENRWATLGEKNIIKDIEVGVISVGHNWNGEEAVKLEKKVLTFFGFKIPDDLFWSYQWTDDVKDESKSGYKEDTKAFDKEFNIMLKESIIKFADFIK